MKAHPYFHYDSEANSITYPDGSVGEPGWHPGSESLVQIEEATYVRSDSRINRPVWIRLDLPYWSVRFQGHHHSINWEKFTISSELVHDFRKITIEKMKGLSPIFFTRVRSLLNNIAAQGSRSHSGGLGNLSESDLKYYMNKLPEHDKSLLRTCYDTAVALSIQGCTTEKKYILDTTRAILGRTVLPNVRRWHPHKGALTSAELGRVDKRGSLDLRPVIQALLHVGDELGAQPDI